MRKIILSQSGLAVPGATSRTGFCVSCSTDAYTSNRPGPRFKPSMQDFYHVKRGIALGRLGNVQALLPLLLHQFRHSARNETHAGFQQQHACKQQAGGQPTEKGALKPEWNVNNHKGFSLRKSMSRAATASSVFKPQSLALYKP